MIYSVDRGFGVRVLIESLQSLECWVVWPESALGVGNTCPAIEAENANPRSRMSRWDRSQIFVATMLGAPASVTKLMSKLLLGDLRLVDVMISKNRVTCFQIQ